MVPLPLRTWAVFRKKKHQGNKRINKRQANRRHRSTQTQHGQRDTHSAIRRHRESSAISASKWRRSVYERARVCLINSTADYTCASVTAAWSVFSSWLIRTLNGNQGRYWCKAQEEVCTASRQAKKNPVFFVSSQICTPLPGSKHLLLSPSVRLRV